MSKKKLLEDLVSLAEKTHPEANYNVLIDRIYSKPLTLAEQQSYLQLLDVARSLQHRDSSYEIVYRYLLNLYVLNGSRIEVLDNINRWLTGIYSGRISLVLISGVSGIGKTSLAMSFQLRVQLMDAAFIVSRSLEQDSTSFALWQTVAQSIETVTSASRTDLLAPIGTGPPAKSSQHLAQEVGVWLSQCANSQPLVILLDDLHWADADSLELLNNLTNNQIQVPILFIATYRSEEIHRERPLYDYLPELQRNRPIERIHLDSLSQDDIKRLFTAYHGMCSHHLEEYLHNQAEGHPLFTVELLNNLITNDLLTQDENGYWLPPEESVPVPKILSQLIAQRVSRLGDLSEELLSIAAVAGEIWHLQIIEQLLDTSEDNLLEALEIALHAEVITVEDDATETYRFSHGFIKQVLYEQHVARRRKRLHARIADQFEIQLPSSIYAIAYHYFEAGTWEKVIQYSTLAAEQATRSFTTKSAVQLYQQVLHAAKKMGNEVDPTVYTNTYERLGRIYLTLEQRKEAINSFTQMRDAAQESNDLVAEGQALSRLANVYIASYELDLAEKYAIEARKIAEQTDDTHLHARTLFNLGRLQLMIGKVANSEKNLKESVDRAETLNNSVTLAESVRYFAIPMLWTSQYDQAELRARRALKLAQQTDDLLLIANGYQTLSYALIESGQYTEAQYLIRTILDFGTVNNAHIHKLSRLLNQMGWLYLDLGDAEQAFVWDKRAIDNIHHTGNLTYYEMERYSLLNAATDLVHLNRLDEAQDYIKQFEAVTANPDFARYRYYNRYLLLMSELNIAQNVYEQAIKHAQEARTLAEIHDNFKNIAKSHWYEGQARAGLRQFGEAIKHLNQAVEIADQIQHGSLRWKIRLSLASTLISDGKSPDEVIKQTRDLMDQLHQSLAQSDLEQSFLSSNWMTQLEQLEQHPTPEKPSYPAGLTEREVEVLRLVAQGATNREIADILHIGIRTVHTHVRNILNKTNSDNRTAAAAFAIDHKIVST